MTTHEIPVPGAVVSVPCPWCVQALLVVEPLPDELRCDRCGIALALDPGRRSKANATGRPPGRVQT